MGQELATGSIRVLANRAGTVSEITAFLTDFENAYTALYAAESFWFSPPRKRKEPVPLELLRDFGYFYRLGESRIDLRSSSIVPDYQLIITRISIESPGFWEFVASLNPLQQIREYLNDRHGRIQDKDYRNAAEKERLQFENEIIQQQITQMDNSILRERIAILHDLGYSNQEIRQLVWSNIGEPLARLGKHQDSGLIEGAE